MKYGRFNQSFIHKGLKDIKREGIIYFILKTNRFFLHRYLDNKSDYIVNKIKKKKIDHFIFNNEKIPYLIHPYNLTWINERTIEVPIILNYLKKINSKKVLEFGAVLLHYIKPEWEVLDKFEINENVLNMDIVDFKEKEKYDLIMSISTLE
ncbi:hypothetical protein GOV12_07645, partial [Candidatus Pacearchaeota archaeon]|nr:hypothetical protein [Candidatus Pacearchaeota archaeon]